MNVNPIGTPALSFTASPPPFSSAKAPPANEEKKPETPTSFSRPKGFQVKIVGGKDTDYLQGRLNIGTGNFLGALHYLEKAYKKMQSREVVDALLKVFINAPHLIKKEVALEYARGIIEKVNELNETEISFLEKIVNEDAVLAVSFLQERYKTKKLRDIIDLLFLLFLKAPHLVSGQKALEYAHNLVGLIPNFIEYAALGEIARLNNQFETAQDCFVSALRLQPDNEFCEERLTMICRENPDDEDDDGLFIVHNLPHPNQ